MPSSRLGPTRGRRLTTKLFMIVPICENFASTNFVAERKFSRGPSIAPQLQRSERSSHVRHATNLGVMSDAICVVVVRRASSQHRRGANRLLPKRSPTHHGSCPIAATISHERASIRANAHDAKSMECCGGISRRSGCCARDSPIAGLEPQRVAPQEVTKRHPVRIFGPLSSGRVTSPKGKSHCWAVRRVRVRREDVDSQNPLLRLHRARNSWLPLRDDVAHHVRVAPLPR